MCSSHNRVVESTFSLPFLLLFSFFTFNFSSWSFLPSLFPFLPPSLVPSFSFSFLSLISHLVHLTRVYTTVQAS